MSPVWGTGVQTNGAGEAGVVTHDGGFVTGELVVLATGRCGRPAGRNFEKLGAKTDAKGRLWCGSNLETVVPGLYATGAMVAEPTMTNGFDAAVAILKDAFPKQAAAAAERRRPVLPVGWSVVG
jgi:pyruvate/2-oxoglutarate dehydrogenase complex dihydrolipoamide dehydrogenase (E3) component